MQLRSKGAKVQIQVWPIIHALQSSRFPIADFLIPFAGITGPSSVRYMVIFFFFFFYMVILN